ncbi:uncharacterized protein [Lepeophtheirus salmonis]|nr:uncharacterized protein LOC121129293 [Lepeophtheirus salmonis]
MNSRLFIILAFMTTFFVFSNQLPMGYSYGYSVDYPETDSYFGANQEGSEYLTMGEYYVLLPDGRLQTVNYRIDSENSGYVADVTYSDGNTAYVAYKGIPEVLTRSLPPRNNRFQRKTEIENETNEPQIASPPVTPTAFGLVKELPRLTIRHPSEYGISHIVTPYPNIISSSTTILAEE